MTSYLVENITDTTPAPVLYTIPGASPVFYTIPNESPPPYTPPTKMYSFPAQPPGYVTPPEGWKIEGLPTYNEEGRVSLVSINYLVFKCSRIVLGVGHYL